MESALLLIPIFLLFIDKNKDKKSNRSLMIVIFIILFSYAAFREYFLPRSMIGVDYYSYQSWFYNTTEINNLSDIGFNFLILVVKKITTNYNVFVAITSFIMLFNFFIFSIKNSKNYHYSIFVFICFGIFSLTFNGLRQCMACSIWLLGFECLTKKRGFIKYAIITLIASTFHNSVIVLILLYPLNYIKIKPLYRVIILGMISIFLKSDFAIHYILSNFSVIDDIYLTRYYGTENISASNLVVFTVSLVVFISILLQIKKYNINEHIQNAKFNYLLLLVFVGFIAPYHLIYSRMLFYFMPAMMLSVPDVFNLYDRDLGKVFKVTATVLFLLMLYT